MTLPNKALCFLTYRCTGSCKHCFINYEKYNPRGEIGYDQWKSAIEFLDQIGIKKLILLGGEPTTLPYSHYILMTALQLRFSQVDVQTNGYIPNSNILEYLTKYRPDTEKLGFTISIEDYTQAYNDYIRGEGTFKAALISIHRYKALGYHTTMRTTIFSNNDIIGQMKQAKKLGVNFAAVRFLPLGTYGEKMGELVPDAKRMANVYLQFLEEKKKIEMKNATIEDNQYYLFDKDLFTDHAKKTFLENKRACPAGNKEIAIDPFGGAYTCQMAMDRDKYPQFYLGNIFKDSWGDLVEGIKKFNEWRNNLPILKHCENCELYKYCGGSCTMWATMTGKIGDPFCPLEYMKTHTKVKQIQMEVNT